MRFDIILASASPRRKELLGLLFSEFKVCPSAAEEILPDGIKAGDCPEYLAKIKASDIAVKHPESLVIGADTVVLADGKILGKPKSTADARQMLKMLSGKTHKVITGCALVLGEKQRSFSVTTEVEFYELCDSEIEDYILTNEPFDKAGGYGIQSKGAVLVKGIKGDYFNVVGLPVATLDREIKKIITNA